MTKKVRPPPEPVKPNAARKVTLAQWDAGRVLWEADPKEDFVSIAARLGCTKQRVAQVAREKGWRRKADMAAINALAQTKADQHFKPADIPGLGPQDSKPSSTPPSAADLDRPAAAAEERAAGLRADVVLKHRNAWRVVYGLLNEAVQGRNMEKAKLAKTSAETLKITQEGERKAWGMDTPEDDGKPSATVKVTIEREEVKREA